MRRFARRHPKVNLALSLHAAIQERREAIVPLAKRHPLDELRDALVELQRIQGRRVLIEYIMLKDQNDSDEDRESAAILAGGARRSCQPHPLQRHRRRGHSKARRARSESASRRRYGIPA